MAAILDGGKLTLSGDVGALGGPDYFTHTDVLLALAEVDDSATLDVYLNSGGGYVDDGAAIHALLSRRAGATNITVDGVAASAASLIAMVGDKITMSAGSTMMIHDPATIAIGNAEDLRRGLDMLETLSVSFARVYAARSGKSYDECRAIMKAERWFSPDEAVSEGFADAVADREASAFAAFDYRAYANAPQRLRTMAKSKDWTSRPTAHRGEQQNKQTPQTDEEDMTKLAAAEARIKELESQIAARETGEAIMALDEAQGRETLAKAVAASGLDVEGAKKILVAAGTGASRMSAEEADEAYAREFYAGDRREATAQTRSMWSGVAARMSHDEPEEEAGVPDRPYAVQSDDRPTSSEAKAKAGWSEVAARMSTARQEEV